MIVGLTVEKMTKMKKRYSTLMMMMMMMTRMIITVTEDLGLEVFPGLHVVQ